MIETKAATPPCGGVLHDINNNLATVVGTVDILLTQVDAQGEIGDGPKDVMVAALTMQELVRQIPHCQRA